MPFRNMAHLLTISRTSQKVQCPLSPVYTGFCTTTFWYFKCCFRPFCSFAVRVRVIETLSPPWQGGVLPLNHTRSGRHDSMPHICFSSAPTRNRTQNSTSEASRDIRFTIGACLYSTALCYDLEMLYRIPNEASAIGEGLRKTGYESYLVGGCVRDLIIGIEPKDWDIATNATPEQIQAVFPDSFYENEYGTVGVKTGSENNRLAIIEVTPYRIESGYSDKRRPDTVKFGTSLLEDLARRDFTINAIALDDAKGHIVDPYNGQKDIKDKLVRAVGNAQDRFNEDALRMLRRA